MSDLEMTRGDTAEWEATVYHPITKAVIDLTGATVRFMAKRSYDDLDADAIVNISSAPAGGITILVPETEGKIHLKVPSSQTEGLENDNVKLWFQLQVESGTSKWTVDRGPFLVRPDVILA